MGYGGVTKRSSISSAVSGCRGYRAGKRIAAIANCWKIVNMRLFVLQLVGQLLRWSHCPSPSITSLQPPCCYCVCCEQCVVLAARQQDGQASFCIAPSVINSSPAQAAPSLIAHLIRSLYPSGHISPINLCLVTVAGRKYGRKQITLPGWIRVQTAIWSLYYL